MTGQGAIADRLPLSVADYMAACLGDPVHGYYTTRDPLGRAGDFVTAPEISQMFGEMLGAWVAQVHADQGRARPLILAELGPGRGTLMADMLRVLDRLGAGPATRPVLVETSPVLRAVQAKTLAGRPVVWIDRIEALPGDAPLIVIANEFFDALPIRQFRRVDGLWQERLVVPGPAFGYGPPRAVPALDRRYPLLPDGVLVELAEAGEALIGALGPRVARMGGAVLVIDYGAWEGTGDTLQAVSGHRPADPLAAPGAQDLTAHVQFRWLAEAALPLVAEPLATQGAFLERLGITARARRLAARPGQADAVAAAHRRLTHPQAMGGLFRVLGLRPAGAPVLPGFGP